MFRIQYAERKFRFVKSGDRMSQRRPRADALRNRAKVLEAATRLLTERGIELPVRDIADEAGVGLATMYRQFPTKEALFTAVVHDRMASFAAEAERRAVANTGEGLFEFFEFYLRSSGPKGALVDELINAGVDVDAEMPEVVEALTTHTTTLIDQAIEAGTARPDLTIETVIALLSALSHGQERGRWSSDVRSQVLSTVLDGVRAHRSA